MSRNENHQEALEDLRKAERFSEHLEATFLRRSKSIERIPENSRFKMIQNELRCFKEQFEMLELQNKLKECEAPSRSK